MQKQNWFYNTLNRKFLSIISSSTYSVIAWNNTDPEIILADEPTGNLDVETGRSIVELLQKICQSGSAIIMITHNLNMLSEYPGTVYKFENHGIKNISTQISDF